MEHFDGCGKYGSHSSGFCKIFNKSLALSDLCNSYFQQILANIFQFISGYNTRTRDITLKGSAIFIQKMLSVNVNSFQLNSIADMFTELSGFSF